MSSLNLWPLNKYWTVALVLGAAVITTTVLQVQYGPGGYNPNLQNFFDALATALGFLLAIFVFLTAQARPGVDVARSAKMFFQFMAWAIILFAFVLIWTTPDAKWTRVRNNVAVPILQGAAFAVPLLTFGYF